MNIEYRWLTDDLSLGQTQSSHREKRNNKKAVTCCSEQPEQKHLLQLRRSAARSPGSSATLPSQQDSGQLM